MMATLKLSETISCYILLFILGIFSGWANENFSVGIIGFILCYMWQYKKKYNLIPQFSIWGLLVL